MPHFAQDYSAAVRRVMFARRSTAAALGQRHADAVARVQERGGGGAGVARTTRRRRAAACETAQVLIQRPARYRGAPLELQLMRTPAVRGDYRLESVEVSIADFKRPYIVIYGLLI
jgi:hypothetical protein